MHSMMLFTSGPITLHTVSDSYWQGEGRNFMRVMLRSSGRKDLNTASKNSKLNQLYETQSRTHTYKLMEEFLWVMLGSSGRKGLTQHWKIENTKSFRTSVTLVCTSCLWVYDRRLFQLTTKSGMTKFGLVPDEERQWKYFIDWNLFISFCIKD